MTQDPYTALWLSYSSIRDFQNCPKSYFFKQVYRDPSSGHKITLITPALATGQAVHTVLESLSVIPTRERFTVPLWERLDQAWHTIAGQKGGFRDDKEEATYKQIAREMLQTVTDKPGPLERLAVKIRRDLPRFWLNEEKGIILCGKIDWLEYLPDKDAVAIVDFKTSKRREPQDSLQLPIYYLIALRAQNRPVTGMSYWYLRLHDSPEAISLPDETELLQQLQTIAIEIQLARKLGRFVCPEGGGCRYCEPLDRIVGGEGVFVGENEFRADVYILPTEDQVDTGVDIL